MGNKQGSSCTQNHPYGYGSGSKSRKSRELQMDWWSFSVLAMQEIGVANDSAQPRGIHGPLKWRCNTWYDFLMMMIMVGFSSSSCQLVNMKMCVSIIRKFPVDNHNLVSGGRWFHIRVGSHDRSNLHINITKSILSWTRPPGLSRCNDVILDRQWCLAQKTPSTRGPPAELDLPYEGPVPQGHVRVPHLPQVRRIRTRMLLMMPI